MRPIKKGSTDQSVVIRIVDSGDGTPETGVVFNTSGIDLWYRREGATKTSITEATLSALNDAHSDGGVLHIGDGYYRLDLPDAAVATGANGVMVGGTVTGMVVIGCYVPLVDYDPYDATSLGISRIDASISSRASQTSLDTVDDFLDTEIAAILAAVDTEVATIVSQTAASAIRTAVGLASANLDTQLSSIASAVAASAIRAAVGLASANLDTQLSTIDDFLDTEVAAILAAVDTEVATIVTQTGAAAIRTAVGLASANLDTQLSSIASSVAASAIRSAIGLGSANLDTQLAAIAGYLDTEVAAILAAVDTEVAAILADSNELQTDWANGGRLDLLIDAIKAVTDALGATAAARLKISAETMVTGTIDTAGFSPTTTQFEADDITEATGDHFNGRTIIFTSGALQNQATDITDYALATGRGHFTVTALTEAPANNDTFIIV